jgi:hypothetical protein
MIDVENIRRSLSEYLLKHPFLPFSIVMADGGRLEVIRQFQAAVGKTTFLVVEPEGNVAKQLRLSDIRTVEPLRAA